MTTTVQPIDLSVNLLQAILWQYENAPNLVALVQAEQAEATQANEVFWTDWTRDVFDLTTANEFGLSVWSRILDYPITLKSDKRITGKIFGFGVNQKNFENGNFGILSDTETLLGLQEARQLLLLRWFKLTQRPTLPNINKALASVFGPGQASVIDSYDMSSVTYSFTAAPNYKLRDLLNKTDALPRPSGVGAKWQIQVKPSWGFGVNHLNFENGNFGDITEL